MGEIRYLVAIQKTIDGGTFPVLVSSANAVSDDPILLFGWMAGKDFLITNELIVSRGQMSILFGTDAEQDFIQMLMRSINDKALLRIEVKSSIYEGPHAYRVGNTLDVLCKVSSAFPNTGGGYIFNFIGLRTTNDQTSMLPDITFVPRPSRGGGQRLHKR